MDFVALGLVVAVEVFVVVVAVVAVVETENVNKFLLVDFFLLFVYFFSRENAYLLLIGRGHRRLLLLL